MLRITTGTAKNKRLKIPEIEGYRGVQEVAKSAVFSILGEKIENACCLDLYSGSGNMGLEALSRGAASCDFVDENPLATHTIEENLFLCGFIGNYNIYRKDSIKFVYETDQKYDIIFCDPFYKNVTHTHLLKGLVTVLKSKGVIAFFHDKALDLEIQLKDTPLKIATQRHFGQTVVTILKS
jgi:16S rRNA (guanine966-N2)-methyltransferase